MATAPLGLFPPAENVATAVAPARLARALLEAGSAWGTAFPSSHVAVAVVAIDAAAGIAVAVAVLFFGRRLGKGGLDGECRPSLRPIWPVS